MLAVVGIADGILSAFGFCALCGVVCIYVRRMLKKNDKAHNMIAANDAAVADIKAVVNDVKADEAMAAKQAGAVVGDFNKVDIVFPDGHIERRSIYLTIDEDEGCLITDGGRTYHTDAGCFCNWSEEYQSKFTGWQLISINEARQRGMRKCKFCVENDKW